MRNTRKGIPLRFPVKHVVWLALGAGFVVGAVVVGYYSTRTAYPTPLPAWTTPAEQLATPSVRPRPDAETTPKSRPGGSPLPWKIRVGEQYTWQDSVGFRAVEMKILGTTQGRYRVWVKKTHRYYKPLPGNEGLLLPVPGHGEIKLVDGATFHEESGQCVLDLDVSRIPLAILDVPLPDDPVQWHGDEGRTLWRARVGPHLVEANFYDKGIDSPSALLRWFPPVGKGVTPGRRCLWAIRGKK